MVVDTTMQESRNEDKISGIQTPSGVFAALAQNNESAFFTFEVEMALQASWVYRRADRYQARRSTIADGETTVLSLLSDITLSRVSNVAVICLPIAITDLACRQHYVLEYSDDSTDTITLPALTDDFRSDSLTHDPAEVISDTCYPSNWSLLPQATERNGPQLT